MPRITPPGGGSSSASTPVGASVATSESTSSTTYTDLTTSGPAVTVTVPSSGKVIVQLTADMSVSGQTSGWMGVALSGANTVAAADTSAVRLDEYAANFISTFGATIPLSGLAAGSTTFTAKYRSAGTATYANRRIVVTPA